MTQPEQFTLGSTTSIMMAAANSWPDLRLLEATMPSASQQITKGSKFSAKLENWSWTFTMTLTALEPTTFTMEKTRHQALANVARTCSLLIPQPTMFVFESSGQISFLHFFTNKLNSAKSAPFYIHQNKLTSLKLIFISLDSTMPRGNFKLFK